MVGIAMLILPAWLTIHLVRRQRRLATWTRTQATIRHTRKTKYDSSATTGSAATEAAFRARYEYRDATGVPHRGEVEHLPDPKVGDIVEVMYAPDDPSSSDTVYGGSVAGRIVNYSAVFILLGGGGVFLILASLDLISL
nr:DUF3592 domain-containing protein [Nocardioides panzhihuensis]